MTLMSAGWASLAIVLSGLGALYTRSAWRRHGLRGLTRGLAITLLPIAAWLTGTLRLFAVVADWFAGWATGLILSPSVILGTVLAVVSVALLGLSSRLGERPPRAGASRLRRARSAKALAATPERTGSVDDELGDIEALLRKRGIS